jgi:hypothetical protein
MMEIRKCHRSFPAKLVEGKCTRNITRVFTDMNTELKPESGIEKWKAAQSRTKREWLWGGKAIASVFEIVL